jgi:hypothetical protein
MRASKDGSKVQEEKDDDNANAGSVETNTQWDIFIS